MDNQTTIKELRTLIETFHDERGWQPHHTLKNLAMSIAIEAAELMEHFQWSSLQEGVDYLETPEQRDEVAAELADILIYCLTFANSTGIDVSDAIRNKMAFNETRFPVPNEQP